LYQSFGRIFRESAFEPGKNAKKKPLQENLRVSPLKWEHAKAIKRVEKPENSFEDANKSCQNSHIFLMYKRKWRT